MEHSKNKAESTRFEQNAEELNSGIYCICHKHSTLSNKEFSSLRITNNMQVVGNPSADHNFICTKDLKSSLNCEVSSTGRNVGYVCESKICSGEKFCDSIVADQGDMLHQCYDNYIYHMGVSKEATSEITHSQNCQTYCHCECDVNKNPSGLVLSGNNLKYSFDPSYAIVSKCFSRSNSNCQIIPDNNFVDKPLCNSNLAVEADLLYADVSSHNAIVCCDGSASAFIDAEERENVSWSSVDNQNIIDNNCPEVCPMLPERKYKTLSAKNTSNNVKMEITSDQNKCFCESQIISDRVPLNVTSYPSDVIILPGCDKMHERGNTFGASEYVRQTLQGNLSEMTDQIEQCIINHSDNVEDIHLFSQCTKGDNENFESVACNEIYGIEQVNFKEAIDNMLQDEHFDFSTSTLASDSIEPTHMSWDEVLHEAKVLGIPLNKPFSSEFSTNTVPCSPSKSGDKNKKKKNHIMDKLKLAIFFNSKLGHSSADDISYSANKNRFMCTGKSSTNVKVRSLGDRATVGSLGNCNAAATSQQWCTDVNCMCASHAVNRAHSCSIPRSFGLRRTPSMSSRSSMSSTSGYNYTLAPPSSSYPPPPPFRSFSTPTSHEQYNSQTSCKRHHSSDKAEYRVGAPTPHASLLSVRPDSRGNSLGRWSVASSASHEEYRTMGSRDNIEYEQDVFSASAPQSGLNALSSLSKLKDVGWYWGPLSWEDAEAKLEGLQDGSFLVRDSSDDRYLLSLSFRSQGATHHTRIEHNRGMFSFYSQPKSHGATTIIEFIEEAMEHSRTGRFLYFLRPQAPGHPPAPIQLLYPVSRLRNVFTLQHMCRFLIINLVRKDLLPQLPIPPKILSYLQQSQYYAECADEL